MSQESRYSYCTGSLSLGVLASALLLTHCDSSDEPEADDRVMLQTEDSKVGQPREGYQAVDDKSPLTPPQRFLRTDFELNATDEKDDVDVDVNVEEVTAGLRVSVVMSDAEPGSYRVAVHESGGCAEKKALGPVLDLMAPKTSSDKDGVQRSDSQRALGDVEVKADGDGRARWLTSWGTLKDGDDKSVLQRPLVLYQAPEGDGLGEVVACALITMD